MTRVGKAGPGRFAPALALVAIAALVPGAVCAQQQAVQPQSSVPVPSELELNKLVWSTMAAVDHANQAGNYSVLRDLAAPGFQLNNDPARLAAVFQSLRTSGIDLSNSLLLAPTYTAPPRFVQPGVLRLQGLFGLRPTAISFELFYQWTSGRWKLFGVSIAPAALATVQPAPSPPPARPQPPARRRN